MNINQIIEYSILLKHTFIVYDRCVVSRQRTSLFIDLANNFILLFCKDIFINPVFTGPWRISHWLLYVSWWALFLKSKPSQFHGKMKLSWRKALTSRMWLNLIKSKTLDPSRLIINYTTVASSNLLLLAFLKLVCLLVYLIVNSFLKEILQKSQQQIMIKILFQVNKKYIKNYCFCGEHHEKFWCVSYVKVDEIIQLQIKFWDLHFYSIGQSSFFFSQLPGRTFSLIKLISFLLFNLIISASFCAQQCLEIVSIEFHGTVSPGRWGDNFNGPWTTLNFHLPLGGLSQMRFLKSFTLFGGRQRGFLYWRGCGVSVPHLAKIYSSSPTKKLPLTRVTPKFLFPTPKVHPPTK